MSTSIEYTNLKIWIEIQVLIAKSKIQSSNIFVRNKFQYSINFSFLSQLIFRQIKNAGAQKLSQNEKWLSHILLPPIRFQLNVPEKRSVATFGIGNDLIRFKAKRNEKQDFEKGIYNIIELREREWDDNME